MDGLDVKLTEIIDRALGTKNLDGSIPESSATISGLFAAVSQYLAQPVSSEVRMIATTVAELSQAGVADEERFRAALLTLRHALDAKIEQDKAASQLADDPELLQEFLMEAREHLAGVESGILTLEQEPDNKEALNGVFRSFHTIKGLAGFMGAAAVQELAHETENVLDRARSGQLELSEPIIELILKAADELNRYLDKAQTCSLSELPRCDSNLLSSMAAAARLATEDAAADVFDAASDQVVAEAAVAEGAVAEAVGDETLPSPAASPTRSIPSTSELTKKSTESSVVRIETAKLEYLIDMVGELVIAESVVCNDPAIKGSKDPLLSRNITQLARVVQEVQKTSMSMRMVAVGSLFRKMSRLTRDLARKSGKLIELVTVGDDVELDRSIVEDLADPMVHMIRNAVDHGLEGPEDRRLAGKAEKGTVRLKAMHDAGDIVIELSDDGRGMDPARILAKARRQGLISEHETPDEDSVFRLIFEAGFSTAEKVTDMSGRGVGMDVVKKQIQKLRGRVSIRSTLGKGSTFVLRLPLTLAIIDGLVVGVGAQRFILPVFAVREMFSPKPGTFVTLENRVEAALFRDKLLPVIRLSRLFEAAADDRREGVLIVVEGRDQLYCIAVDQLIGKQEVVIKSLGKTFRDIPAISGGAILGDGRVGLIIDVNSLRYRN
jgi:two-component system chemotaxis sensor kinase CheA